MALTLDNALGMYLRTCKRVAPSTLRRNERCFNEFISLFGTVRLDHLRKCHAIEFQAHLLGRGLAKCSVNAYCAAVSSILGFLVDCDEMEANPFGKIKKVKTNKKPVTTWTDDEFARMLDAVEKIRWRDPTARLRWRALLLATHTEGCGLRVGEAQNLRWADIDLDRALLIVRHRPQAPGQWEWGTKSHCDRTVPMGQELYELFYRMQDRCGWMYPIIPKRRYKQLIQRAEIPYEMRCLPWNCYKAFGRIKRVAKVNSSGAFHKSRRSTATAFAAKMQPFQLRVLLGHADLQTTLLYVGQNEKATLEAGREAQLVGTPGLEPGTDGL